MNEIDLLAGDFMTIAEAAVVLGCSPKLVETIAIRHRLLSGVITSPEFGAEVLLHGSAIRRIAAGTYEIPEIKPGVARSGRKSRNSQKPAKAGRR